MAGLCCPPNSLLVSVPSLSNRTPTSVSVSSSPPYHWRQPIRCSKRKKKCAGKAKPLPPSTTQQSSKVKLGKAAEEDVLLDWGAGATTLTALRPRLDDDDPSLQQRQQLQLHIAQQALLQSFRSSPDSLSRLDRGTDQRPQPDEAPIAKLKDSFDEGFGDDDLEKEEGEVEDLDFEWVEVSGEDGDGEDFEEADDDEEGEEYVQYWEGDLGPMTEQEEAELLRQAAIELAQLEKEKRAGKFAASNMHVPLHDAEHGSEDEEYTEGTLEEQEDTITAGTIAAGLNVTSVTQEQQDGAETSEPLGDKEILLTDEEDEDTFIARITKEMTLEERGGSKNDDTSKTKRAIPAVMRCFDRAKVFVKAGNGGNGVVAFRREKFVPFGGPSGGSGGRGGNIYVEADASMNSLLSFRKGVHFRAGRGNHGQGKSQDGATGMDCTVKIPVGTIIREADINLPGSGKILLELTRAGQRELLLPGGRGGRGNAAFKTGRNKTPQLAEYGEEGAEMWLDLELKLVADVGIIGVPNAGKSTLLSVISAAQPAIGAYPFTTLLPNLGVVPMGFEATMVFADLPGLLEGAHLGIGLGHEFLRHTERCRVLVHIIDGTSQQPDQEYEAVRLELELFNPALSEKPYIVVFNKMDIPEAAERWEDFQCFLAKKGIEPLCMSAATKMGTKEVVNRAYTLLQSLPGPPDNLHDTGESVDVGEVVKKERSAPIEQFEIYGDANSRTWEVCGAGLERFTQMTNWEYFEALKRFQRVLSVTGVNRALKERGVSEGDIVTVGEMEFVWHDSEDISTDWKRGFRGSRLWPH